LGYPSKKKVVCWAATIGSPHKLACFVNALSLCCYRIVFLEEKKKKEKESFFFLRRAAD